MGSMQLSSWILFVISLAHTSAQHEECKNPSETNQVICDFQSSTCGWNNSQGYQLTWRLTYRNSSTNKYISLNMTNASTNQTGRLESPLLCNIVGLQHFLRFQYSLSNTSKYRLSLYQKTSETEKHVWNTNQTTSANKWSNVTVQLFNFSTCAFQIIFEGKKIRNGSSENGRIRVDDVVYLRNGAGLTNPCLSYSSTGPNISSRDTTTEMSPKTTEQFSTEDGGKNNIQENKADEGSELNPGYIATIVVTVTIVASVITVAMLCRRYGKTQCGFSTIFKNLSCGSDTNSSSGLSPQSSSVTMIEENQYTVVPNAAQRITVEGKCVGDQMYESANRPSSSHCYNTICEDVKSNCLQEGQLAIQRTDLNKITGDQQDDYSTLHLVPPSDNHHCTPVDNYDHLKAKACESQSPQSSENEYSLAQFVFTSGDVKCNEIAKEINECDQLGITKDKHQEKADSTTEGCKDNTYNHLRIRDENSDQHGITKDKHQEKADSTMEGCTDNTYNHLRIRDENSEENNTQLLHHITRPITDNEDAGYSRLRSDPTCQERTHLNDYDHVQRPDDVRQDTPQDESESTN